MKVSFVWSALAALIAVTVSAQSVDVTSAQMQQDEYSTVIRIASRDLLDRATALLNKNTISTDNNAFISRSNVVFLQNDRLAMRRRVMEDLMRLADRQDTVSVAVLAKSMLRALSAPTTDAALMRKASAVVAAVSRDNDDASPSMLVRRISDFVDAVGKREVEDEDAMEGQTPRGVFVLVGTKDVLRQPTTTIKTTITTTTSDEEPEPQFRVAIVYMKKSEDTKKSDADQEQWGYWGGGYGLGWRYPLTYWNTYGRGFYGGGCGLGFAVGSFYYC